MTTITIPNPKIFDREKELVLIPKKEYEDLRERAVPVIELTSAEKRQLAEARKEMARGEYYTFEELKHELGITRQKKDGKTSRKIS